MESNIRIIASQNLYLIAKKINLSRNNLTAEQLQTLCTILKNRNIAAAPFIENGKSYLITECHEALSATSIELDSDDKRTQFTIDLTVLADTIKLEITNTKQRNIIEELYIKRAQINILKNTNLEIIKKSPNVYYDPTPIVNEEELESDLLPYQKYYVFAEYFENIGLGIGVDVGTSYFTKWSVEKYFSTGNEKRFYQLRERQSTEYKGTLLYKGPNGKSRCYFDRYDANTTLITTDGFSDKGKHYKNSYDYFQKAYPNFPVKPNDKVAFVSFKGMGTVPVPAKCLFLSVSTENLTDDVNQQDKYKPQQKRNLIDGFWKKVGDPFGRNYQKLQTNYYQPAENNCGVFDMPTIMFANGQELAPPKNKHSYTYKKYFLSKYYKLKECGCYYVPPVMERELHFVMPEILSETNAATLINDLSKEVTSLTKKNIEPTDHYYGKGEHLNAIYDLKNNYSKGTVVFVFDNNDPSVYYNISHELKGWKIIRLTFQELKRKLYKLQSNHTKGKGNWEAYIALNAFRVVTELGCVPYMFKEDLHYPAQLIIDVSENYNYFGLGLLIYKQGMELPLFDYIIKPNPDSKNDLINPQLLEKYLKELLSKYSNVFLDFFINKLLVLRDGIENKTEYDVVLKVINDLKSGKERCKLSAEFDFAFIEYHKKSQKSIRLFEPQNGEIKNPLEGSWLFINNSKAIIMNTGEGTLTQGTSNGILIKSNYKTVDLKQVLKDIFLTSQLNFGSPRVAQKLTYLAKRIDQLLKEKRAQEVIKIK